MSDLHYPTIDIDFLISLVNKSSVVQDTYHAGSITVVVLKGTSAIAKRTKYLRKTPALKTVDYIFGTEFCRRIGKLSDLLEWLVENRNWKDGGYIVPKAKTKPKVKIVKKKKP